MRSMMPGVVDSNGNRWERCPSCGDSKDGRRAHMMIDSKGSTYCFKCGESTQLDFESLLSIVLGDKSVDEALEDLSDREEHESERPTLLETFEDPVHPEGVSFEMRDCLGRRIGWHTRRPGKVMLNEGRRGIGYTSQQLWSTPSQPLIVVEGPFDVIDTRAVCVFGAITSSTLKHFRMQWCWLWPDPDILESPLKRKLFAERVLERASEYMVFVQGVIVSNADPDEATIKNHVAFEEALRWTREY